MPDFDHDDLFDDAPLRDAFGQLRTASIDLVPPQGPTAVRRTVRRRRTARATALALALVTAVAVPATLRALAHPPTPPPPATSPSPQPSRSPSAEPSPSASVSPSTSAGADTGASANATGVPDGHISQDDLGNATLSMPGWPAPSDCPAGELAFRNGKFSPPWADPAGYPRADLRAVAYADADHDGAKETAGLFTCVGTQGLVSQVVAFDRDADGRILTLGQVVTYTDKIRYLFDVQDGTDTFGVQVGDVHLCCADDERLAEHQWRRYGFDGTAFHQVGGPTAFTPVAPETTVSVTLGAPVVLGPASDGARTGEVTVTLTGTGANPAPGVVVDVWVIGPYQSQLPVPATITVSGATCDGSPPKQDGARPPDLRCHLAGLQPGESHGYTLTLRVPVADDGVIAVGSQDVRLMVRGTAEQPGIRLIGPRNADERSQATTTISRQA